MGQGSGHQSAGAPLQAPLRGWGRLLLNRPSQDALDTGMKESAGHYPIPWAHSPSPWFMPIFVPLYHLWVIKRLAH